MTAFADRAVAPLFRLEAQAPGDGVHRCDRRFLVALTVRPPRAFEIPHQKPQAVARHRHPLRQDRRVLPSIRHASAGHPEGLDPWHLRSAHASWTRSTPATASGRPWNSTLCRCRRGQARPTASPGTGRHPATCTTPTQISKRLGRHGVAGGSEAWQSVISPRRPHDPRGGGCAPTSTSRAVRAGRSCPSTGPPSTSPCTRVTTRGRAPWPPSAAGTRIALPRPGEPFEPAAQTAPSEPWWRAVALAGCGRAGPDVLPEVKAMADTVRDIPEGAAEDGGTREVVPAGRRGARTGPDHLATGAGERTAPRPLSPVSEHL